MAKSPALTAKLNSFAGKLSGTSVVDNAANPKSAASRMKASINSPATQKNMAMKDKGYQAAKTFGVGVGP